jgi:hypothetical protein
MVDDYIGFAATNHGGLLVQTVCPPLVGCSESWHQQLHNGKLVERRRSTR